MTDDRCTYDCDVTVKHDRRQVPGCVWVGVPNSVTRDGYAYRITDPRLYRLGPITLPTAFVNLEPPEPVVVRSPWRYRSYGRRRGRWSWSAHPGSLTLPRLHIGAEQGGEYLAVSYGDGHSDPVVHAEVDLSGTRLGALIGAVYWRIRG